MQLRKQGREYAGLCPFHAENSPSFTVNPGKGFVHCFGCGAHHDVIGFLMHITGCDFKEACVQLGAREFSSARDGVRIEVEEPLDVTWVPLMPVPEDAPEIMSTGGWTVPIWNPKRGRVTRLKPTRLDAYRDASGELLGYVLRADIVDCATGKTKKWTPQVTWCVGPDGKRQWCLQHFPRPRPLLGLDALAARPQAPVLVVEGEKCRAAGADAWPQYAVISWPGGSHGVTKADWSPLAGRDVVLWPDADAAGDKAMRGWSNDGGAYQPGIAQLAARVGARSIRMIDTAGRPHGWDVADALEVEGWTPRQLAAWAAGRVIELNVVRPGAQPSAGQA
ncbi:CHC2 zinc finger domain-containing protein [Pseudoxanthomonas sp. SE1]|uniref:CHC2 zinc finger domain-containing protein n=1 Tax=Pseudoxanthomonas sp. SE1 TaxID=1664560 RepID=UPI00240D1BF5|nr:CHC2 zinc finger domain-containing protein [Pseudoxanthomonas sp. SE1]WFC43239.1 CHC2 zinc finger domain-containing protein [Pseudoxanthomonas sp. SE1]